MFGMSRTWTRSPTLKRARPATFWLFAALSFFMARPHFGDLVDQLVQRNVLFVDHHSGRGPYPTPVIGHAEIECVAEIVVRPAPSLFGIPHPAPAEHLAGHIGVELPLLFFLFLVIDRHVMLAADIVRRMHEGAIERAGILI